MEALAALESVTPSPAGEDAPNQEAGVIPADWHLNRRVGILRLLPDQRWLDLREHETREELRTRLAAKLLEFGQDDFDLGDALGRDRRISQAVSRFAYDNGFQGIAYTALGVGLRGTEFISLSVTEYVCSGISPADSSFTTKPLWRAMHRRAMFIGITELSHAAYGLRPGN